MTALPLHAIPVLLDDHVRLRVYRGPSLEFDMPLRPRQALALAGLLLNHALMASERTDRVVLKTPGEQRVAMGDEAHGSDIGVSLNKRQTCACFHLSLKPAPHIDADRALRGALKVLLREFGLKCTAIREEQSK